MSDDYLEKTMRSHNSPGGYYLENYDSTSEALSENLSNIYVKAVETQKTLISVLKEDLESFLEDEN